MFQNPNEATARAILGAVGEEDTIALSRASRRHNMPIMGYQAESGLLSDKVHVYDIISSSACDI